MFTGTLRFNLDPFNEYSSAAIEELLIKAGLSDLLNREPEAGDQDDAESHYNNTALTSQ